MSLSFVAFASCEDKDSPNDGNGSMSENSSSVSYSSGTEEGHVYVDLGLPSGTLWAACNIGAAKPWDYGNYYAWGETTIRDVTSWHNYLDGNMLNDDDCGTDKDLLNGVRDIAGTSYDAAKTNWGGKWRMPTLDELNELSNQCYWVWTESYNGSNVKGYIVYKAKSSSDKGKRIYVGNTPSSLYSLSDAHIFLPLTGWKYQYWSSFLCSSAYAYCLALFSEAGSLDGVWLDESKRFYMLSVRAVINKNVPATSTYKSGTENGYDYVDLGLPSGTKWATANVGASKPQDYGNYYAWGETTTKETYNWSNYKYGSDYNQLTKYCNNSYYGKDGFTDSKTTLDLSDDAAYVNWGGKWRMPTKTQQKELYNECYWVFTNSYNLSGVEGYIVYKAKTSSDKGKKIYDGETPSSSYTLSDAHIFLPAAGYRIDGYLDYAREDGYYWSSSLDSDISFHAWAIYFNLYYVHEEHRNIDTGGDGDEMRYYGQSVRAVFK